MAEDIAVRLVDSPEEALSPRELRLERGGLILRWGAIINGVLTGLVFILALLGGLRILPNLFPTLHNLLLGRVAIGDDAAAAEVILLLQLDISFLLVVAVGLLAREVWALIGVWVLVVVNMLMLPHPAWFWIAGLAIFPVAGYAGGKLVPTRPNRAEPERPVPAG